MAYVRVTQTLLTQIQQKCSEMSRREIQNLASYKKVDQAREDEFAEALQKAAYAAAPDLRGKLPDDWTTKVDPSIYFVFDVNTLPGCENYPEAKISVDWSTDTNREKRKPHGFHTGWSGVRLDASMCTEGMLNQLKAIANTEKQSQEIKTKYLNISNQLVQYLSAHTSVNAALKDMPELEMYLPQHTIEKLEAENAPRSRKKAEKPDLPNIDRQALAAQAIAHRISGGV